MSQLPRLTGFSRIFDKSLGKDYLIPQNIPMLGKRTKQRQYKPRKLYKAPYSRSANPYGKGYNPKAVSTRKPPPGAEKKYYDTGTGGVTMVNAATTSWPAHSHVTTLNNIAQGDKMNERNGNKITLKSVDLRVICGAPRTSNATFSSTGWSPGPQLYRIIMYVDTQCNGASLTIDDMFQDEPTSSEQFLVFNKLEETGRVKVLWDKFVEVPIYTLEHDGSDYHTAGGIKMVKKHVELNLPVMYGDNTSNTSAIRTNNVGIFFFSNYQATHEVAFRARVRFYDY